MEHYSIHAIDIFIDEIAANKGWHRGDAIQYKVNNCAWESQIELQLKANQHGNLELQGMQTFQHGDQDKMLKDQEIMQMAIQAHIYKQHKDRRVIKWVLAEENW